MIDEILEKLRAIFIKDPYISKHSFDKLPNKPVSSRTIRKYFGSWSNAKQEILGKDEEPEDTIQINKDFGEKNGTVTTKSLNIRTVEDALEAANINVDEWKVIRSVINSWEVTVGANKTKTGEPETYTNWQVKVWLQKKVEEIEIRNLVNTLIQDMRNHSPIYETIHYKEPSSVKKMAEICIFDMHHGKHAWKEETGTDYDLKISKNIQRHTIDFMLQKIDKVKPELILFPCGNDLLHIDNIEGTTTKGTKQDVDDRSTKIFREVFLSMVEAIDKMTIIAPVEVYMIPGNHDTQSIFHLGVALEAAYKNNSRVTIDNSAGTRKYKKYGNNLIGFVHAAESDPKIQDLPFIMLQEQRENCGLTAFKEYHCGHIHKRREIKFTSIDTFGEVTIRFVPGLSGNDFWHSQHGFKAVKAAESYIWNYDGGYDEIFVYNPSEDLYKGDKCYT